MAYNTKPIVTDKDGNPISQYYNPTTDSYEPVEGSGGGNKVVLYNADGTENNGLSLISILDKLSQLTGTVIDEETRKSNELLRIELYNQISQMLIDGELKGDKGDIGLGLEYDWQGTSLGVRVEGEDNYIYVDLKGPKGDKGETGDMENLNAQHIEDALGYVPADEDIIGLLSSLTTDEKVNLVSAINEVKSQSNENATGVIIESGSNDNGRYVKFADGTLIAHRELTVVDIGDFFKTIGEIDFSLPITFVGYNFGGMTINDVNTVQNRDTLLNKVYTVIGSNKITIQNREVVITGIPPVLSLWAIGRWKA